METLTEQIRSKKITHIHDGMGHTLCGIADDDLNLAAENKAEPDCKGCINHVRSILQIAAKYDIKLK